MEYWMLLLGLAGSVAAPITVMMLALLARNQRELTTRHIRLTAVTVRLINTASFLIKNTLDPQKLTVYRTRGYTVLSYGDAVYSRTGSAAWIEGLPAPTSAWTDDPRPDMPEQDRIMALLSFIDQVVKVPEKEEQPCGRCGNSTGRS